MFLDYIKESAYKLGQKIIANINIIKNLKKFKKTSKFPLQVGFFII